MNDKDLDHEQTLMDREELLQLLLDEEQMQIPRIATIERRTETSPTPLSFAQQRLWFLDHMRPGNVAYNLYLCVHANGRLRTEALRCSFAQVLRRHESLRTTFPSANDQPIQRIKEEVEVAIRVVDLEQLPQERSHAYVAHLTAVELARPFDLQRGPLIRLLIIRIGPDEHVLYFTMHHVISDAWSLGLLTRELSINYEAYMTGRPSPLPPLRLQYADYAKWQQQRLTGHERTELLSYWRQKLAEHPDAVELPADLPRPAVPTSEGQTLRITIPQPLLDSLTALGKRHDATLFMTMLAGFKALLFRWTGQRDLMIGSPIAGRTVMELEEMIGFFVNTLVLRSQASERDTFSELLDRVRQTALEAYANQDLPFDQLVDELRPGRQTGREPFFQIMFVLQNAPFLDVKMPSLSLEPLATTVMTSKFDLTVTIEEINDGLSASFEYSRDLYLPATIDHLAQSYVRLLEGIVSQPTCRLVDLPLMTDDQERALVAAGQGTRQAARGLQTHQLFERQTRRTPDAIAVVYGDQAITYQALNRRANQLSRYLCSQGVVAGDHVGICMEQSVDMICGMLGTLKAGAAYMPMSPAYPAAQLRMMLDDSPPACVLTHDATAETVSRMSSVRIINLDSDGAISNESDRSFDSSASADYPVYVIHTSGSTGKPKKIGVVHNAFVNLIDWYVDEDEVEGLQRVLVIAAFNFDLTQKNYFAPLSVGATLHFLDSNLYDIDQIRALIASRDITLVNCAPSAFYPLVDETNDGDYRWSSSLRRVVLGGEPIAIDRLQPWLDSDDCQAHVVNSYGPTECTDVCAFYRWRPEKHVRGLPIPIGKPIPNTSLLVLDRNLRLAPPGALGELCIAGCGVSTGYLGDSAMTAHRFLPDAWTGKPGGRIYRTGDLVRRLHSGLLTFLGRMDQQIKLHGIRVDPREVETLLSEHESVRECAVKAAPRHNGSQRLVAYIVPRPDANVSSRELRDHLAMGLPTFMVPGSYVILPDLPRTPSGKLDYAALPRADDVAESEHPSTAPQTETERQLAEIWSEVLQCGPVGVNADFFEIGGGSILATQTLSRIRRAFRVDLPLRWVFEQPTVAQLAATIDKMRKDPHVAAEPRIQRVSRETYRTNPPQ